jgi:hypothetical protein
MTNHLQQWLGLSKVLNVTRSKQSNALIVRAYDQPEDFPIVHLNEVHATSMSNPNDHYTLARLLINLHCKKYEA